MTSFADRVNEFNANIRFDGTLPEGVRMMNPFMENEYICQISARFYRKFYNDNNRRHLILGINPGRFGAGYTGIPFTDTKRLTNECGLKYSGRQTHELSSVFIYDVINRYGGAEKFYHDFYINSVCPLGFISVDDTGREKNLNYYDRHDLTESVTGFIIESVEKQIALGVETDICLCLGTGRNEKFLVSLNDRYKFFRKIVAIEHPRWVMQYRLKKKEEYIGKYIDVLTAIKKRPKP